MNALCGPQQLITDEVYCTNPEVGCLILKLSRSNRIPRTPDRFELSWLFWKKFRIDRVQEYILFTQYQVMQGRRIKT